MTDQEDVDQVSEFLGIGGGTIEISLQNGAVLSGVLDTPGILFSANGFGGVIAGTPSALKIDCGAEGRHLVPWTSVISIKYID